MSTETTECEVYFIEDLVKILGASRSTVLKGLRTGKIPAHRIGSKWFISKQQFYEWLNSAKAIPIGKRV